VGFDSGLGQRIPGSRTRRSTRGGETVDTAPSYRQGSKKRRCLIPADGFYEWKKILEAKSHTRSAMKDDSPFVFAGLWKGWKDPANNQWLHALTTITGEPNCSSVRSTPGCRSSLAEEHHGAWLSGEAGKEILVPYPADRMKAWLRRGINHRVRATRINLEDFP
jgi:putative SOS response-associated peptidase YedK